MPTLEQIMSWVKDNQLMLGLVGSALVGAMPENLPGFRAFPQWAWTWFRDTAKTFLNFKHGIVDPNAGMKIEKKDSVAPAVVEKKEDKKPTGPIQLNG